MADYNALAASFGEVETGTLGLPISVDENGILGPLMRTV